jgi:hypothetical protein
MVESAQWGSDIEDIAFLAFVRYLLQEEDAAVRAYHILLVVVLTIRTQLGHFP